MNDFNKKKYTYYKSIDRSLNMLNMIKNILSVYVILVKIVDEFVNF